MNSVLVEARSPDSPERSPSRRREVARLIALAAGVILCVALSAALVLLAVDVTRQRHALGSGDVRYAVAPADPALWQADLLLPFGIESRLLETDDDVAFRRAVRALRRADLGSPSASISDPEVAIRQNEAQARLEAVLAEDADPSRRSQAAGFLGVLGLARLVTETENREALLSSTVASLRLAIALDPSHDDAKYNLEQAYQRGRGLQLTEASGGDKPSPGGTGSSGAGAGEPGSGY